MPVIAHGGRGGTSTISSLDVMSRGRFRRQLSRSAPAIRKAEVHDGRQPVIGLGLENVPSSVAASTAQHSLSRLVALVTSSTVEKSPLANGHSVTAAQVQREEIAPACGIALAEHEFAGRAFRCDQLEGRARPAAMPASQRRDRLSRATLPGDARGQRQRLVPAAQHVAASTSSATRDQLSVPQADRRSENSLTQVELEPGGLGFVRDRCECDPAPGPGVSDSGSSRLSKYGETVVQRLV